MTGMVSRKSRSLWWESHISLKNSKWMAESLEEIDRCVKEILQIIEDEGDSFAKKAEVYYKKRPQLISHVEDFHRMYRSLAERYDHVTGELRSRNVSSVPQHQESADGSDVGSKPMSPFQSPTQQTPDPKLPRQRPKKRAAGFDFVLGSGGSSDSRKDTDTSSSSGSESDSDGVDNQVTDCYPDPDYLFGRVLELEGELNYMKQKLQQLEDCAHGDSPREYEAREKHDFLSRVEELETKLTTANKQIQSSQETIEQLKRDLETSVEMEAELHIEKEQKSKLETQITTLESALADYKSEIEELNTAHSTVMFRYEQMIQSLEEEIVAVRERSTSDKFTLEADIADRDRSISDLVTKFTEEKMMLDSKVREQSHVVEKLNFMLSDSSRCFSEEKLQLQSEILSLSELHSSLNLKLASLEDRKKHLELEKAEISASNSKGMEELNSNLDSHKLKHDMLSTENDELSAKLSTLMAEVDCRDNRICELETHLHQLHSEHTILITENENARRSMSEMKEHITDLEEEIETQKAMLYEGAEKKREAIRQLCFSLDHYRDGYKELRQTLLGHRRPQVLSTS